MISVEATVARGDNPSKSMGHTMADIYSKRKRTKIMRAVRSKDSKLEVDFRKALWHQGFRYRKNVTGLFGKPDLVLGRYRTVIFIDSCFWHGCRWHCHLPATRRRWWLQKIERNKVRDREVTRYYKRLSWNIIRLWEHDLKKSDFMFDVDLIRRGVTR